jgi:hypothetical protein
VLDYLGRYVFRVAISNSRLEHVGDEHVTFRYRDNRTQEARRVTLTGIEFLTRFVQHVLPRGCAKVRYYGLWSAARRADLARARDLLRVPTDITPVAPAPSESTPTPRIPDPPRCPHCQQGHLILIAVLRPWWRGPP